MNEVGGGIPFNLRVIVYPLFTPYFPSCTVCVRAPHCSCCCRVVLGVNV